MLIVDSATGVLSKLHASTVVCVSVSVSAFSLSLLCVYSVT